MALYKWTFINIIQRLKNCIVHVTSRIIQCTLKIGTKTICTPSFKDVWEMYSPRFQIAELYLKARTNVSDRTWINDIEQRRECVLNMHWNVTSQYITKTFLIKILWHKRQVKSRKCNKTLNNAEISTTLTATLDIFGKKTALHLCKCSETHSGHQHILNINLNTIYSNEHITFIVKVICEKLLLNMEFRWTKTALAVH